MAAERLRGDQIARLLRAWPAGVGGLALELREAVLSTLPGVSERIAFRSLACFKPGQPYGVIGGNVCLIGPHKGRLYLSFIHGVHLPDPGRLLAGSAESKRYVEIRSVTDIRRQTVRDLLRAALAYQEPPQQGA